MDFCHHLLVAAWHTVSQLAYCVAPVPNDSQPACCIAIGHIVPPLGVSNVFLTGFNRAFLAQAMRALHAPSQYRRGGSGMPSALCRVAGLTDRAEAAYGTGEIQA